VFNFKTVKAIIFDLDDTLVKTKLDFTKLKKQIGCKQEDDILSFIERLKCPVQKAKASEVVLSHELDDAQTSTWMPGAKKFVQQAHLAQLPLAIVTRNCKQATQAKMLNNNIKIDIVMTREDGPAKPDPSTLLAIAKHWQIPPPDIAYIGDYIYDIQAAHNSNMQAWLYKQKDTLDCHDYAKHLRYIASE
jgi:HAD superfamily hydrolase (TIGR01509 family)